MRHKLLLIDDEPAVLRLLDRIFYRDYDVVCAASGEEAFERLKENLDVAVILSDLRLPGIDGTGFLEIAADVCPQTQRFILTGYANAKELNQAIAEGIIHNYVTKPWGNEHLKAVVTKAVQDFNAALKPVENFEQAANF